MSLRTLNQNSAMHLYFSHIAMMLNDNNITVEMTLKPDTQWSPNGIKEMMWRPVQKAVTGKASTTKLTTKELTEIYDIINKVLSQKFGIYIPFPSIDELILQEKEREYDKTRNTGHEEES